MKTAIEASNIGNDIEHIETAYLEYSKHFPKKAIFLKSTIFHHLLPYKGFGLNFDVAPKDQIRGARMKQVWELSKKIKLSDLWDINRVLTWQEEVFDSLDAPSYTRQPNKHYLKHFLEWCRDQGHLKPPKTEEWSVPQSLPGTSKAFHRRGGRERNLVTNRSPIVEYGVDLNLLSNQLKLEFYEFSAFWDDQHYKGIRPISKPIEEATLKERLERLSYLIGWLVLDKLDYHRRMCERARQRKEQNPNYESAWLSVDPEPPNWLVEMQETYSPRSLETLELDDLVPLIEIRSGKLLEKLSLQREVLEEEEEEEEDKYGSLLTKIQAQLKAQNAAFDFETVVQLTQALHYNSNFVKEVKRLNQVNAESTVGREAEAQMQIACTWFYLILLRLQLDCYL